MKKCCYLVLALALPGCADKYDRMTSRMMLKSFEAKGSLSLNTISAPAVELYYIQRYGATALQKKAAEESAQRYLMGRGAAARTRDAQPARGTANETKTPSRYVAVDVPRAATSKGSASVMVFDTQSQHIVGNSVYDLGSKPAIRQPVKFDTYSAQYVGDGSTAK